MGVGVQSAEPAPAAAEPTPDESAPLDQPAPEQPDAAPDPAPQPDPATQPAPEPQEITLLLRDGTRLNGMLVSDEPTSAPGGGGVTIRIGGVTTTFPQERVDKYEILPPVEERYVTLRQAVGNDADQIVQLAEWLRTRGRYTLAYAEIERALTIAPSHPEALRLKKVIAGQIVLKERQVKDNKPAEAARPADQPAPGEMPDRAVFPLLSKPEINLMKVYEVDLAAKPRVLISRDTILRMLQKHGGSPLVPVTEEGRDAITRKPVAEVLELMFRLQARDFYREVEVLDLSPGMKAFRDDVQRTWLLNSCSTTMCHGGTQAGRLQLFNRRPNSDATLYTNFLIVERFRLADGTPLLNYENPARSPLLQMGLPREDSLFPHPEVPRGTPARDAWKRVFRSTEDKQFTKSVEWLKTMYQPRPEYPIEYDVPAPPQMAPKQDEPAADNPAER